MESIEGQMTKIKGVGRRRRRRTRLLDNLRNRKRYWEVIKAAEYQKKVEKTVYYTNIRNGTLHCVAQRPGH